MLVRKNYVFLGIQAFVATGLLAGCVITESPTGSTGAGGTMTTATTTTTATTGTGGEGGSGVGGGTTTSTGTGGVACVGETGKGVVADCDNLNITPESHGGGASPICGPNLDEEPPGYVVCTRGFTLFNPGAATTLVECLATIGVESACKSDPLQACVDKMFADECVIPAITTTCDSIKTQCGADPFDAVQCGKDLNPFSDAGVMEISTCFNKVDPTISCQKAFDDCYTEVFTF